MKRVASMNRVCPKPPVSQYIVTVATAGVLGDALVMAPV